MKRLLLSFKVLLATMLLFAGGNAWATEVTLTYSDQGYSNQASLDGVAITVDGVTFQLDKASASNAPAYYTGGSAARMYPSSTLTVSSAAGNITAITLNAVQGKSGSTTTLTADAGSLEDLAWTGDASSVVFTAAGSGHLRITSITVTVSEDAAAVKIPVASLANGTYFGSQSVELTCETEGATIYYTTDGTEPTGESTEYTGAIEISETTTLKAIAINGEDKSSVLTRTYTIGATYENIAALVAGAQSGDVAQLTLTDAVVTYVNGKDVFVQDASGALDFYTITKIGDTELVAGSVLSGTAKVTYSIFNGLPEIKSLDGEVTVTAGEAPAATAMSVADALKAENLSKYITISPAIVAENGGIVSGTDTLATYCKWGTTIYEGLYDQITGIVSTYNGMQLKVISADTTKYATVADGVYYLQNVATKQYFCGANSWGTQASLNASGIDVTLARLANGTYTIDTQLSNGGDNHYLSDVWCDGAATGHGLYAVEGAENTYYIGTAGGYLAYDGSTTVLIASDTQDENAQWVLLTEEDRLAELNAATQDAPVNATYLIKDPNFSRNDTRESAWTKTNVTIGISNGDKGEIGPQYGNNNAESYHKTFSITQDINLIAGVYSLTAQGFYRQDGSDNDNLPVFFIGDETTVFPLKTGSENSMYDAAVSFTAGSYTSDPVYINVAEDGTYTVGAKLENNTTLWCIWDNFQLTYYGKDANIEQLKNAALYKQLATLLEEAETLAADETLHATKLEALNAAITAGEAAQDGTDVDAINAAITALTDANADAAAYQKAGDVLSKMKEVVESTNVYTEEALNEYYTQWQAKYDDGTITEEEAKALEDPTAKTGWRASNKVDDFLLSAWNKEVQTWGDFHVNTWSTEAENGDGSEFYRPFIEYWVSSGTLSENSISATINGLAPGEYTVSALVRVGQGVTSPSGITMQANDGDAVSVCEGTYNETTKVYIDTVSVTGVVGADSTLTITFNVAADNNISWFSFKNVKYEAPATTLEIPVSAERMEGLGFQEQTIDIDLDAAMEFLGITDISEATDIAINMSNDSIITDAMTTYDGWLNKQGDFAMFGNASYAYAKFNPLHKGTETGYYYSGDGILFGAWPYDGAPVGGESITFKYGLQANGKTVIYVVTVNFTEKPAAQYTKLSELEVLETVTVNHEMNIGQAAYTSTTNTFDAAAIAETLGLESLDDVQSYWLSAVDSSLVQATFDDNGIDGWFNASGAPTGWDMTSGGVCVKIKTPSSGSIEILDYGTGTAGTVLHAPYVFATAEGKAVILDVVVTYVDPVGIQSLTKGESLKNAAIYTISGQRVKNVTKGGIYIINGKKVLMK